MQESYENLIERGGVKPTRATLLAIRCVQPAQQMVCQRACQTQSKIPLDLLNPAMRRPGSMP